MWENVFLVSIHLKSTGNMGSFKNIVSMELLKKGQLSYIGQDCEEIPPQLGNAWGDITRRLDLSFNCLKSLDGLELFSNLEELILDNNQLTDEVEFPELPKLHTLSINKNEIKDLDGLLDKIQNKLPSLTYLSLLGNQACPDQLSSLDRDEDDYLRYRSYVLYRLPQLKFIDSTTVKEEMREEASRVGPYLKVVRPTAEEAIKQEEEDTSPYSPLPRYVREEPEHIATFGKCRYVYYGRHSEGNRFIRNSDL